MEIEGKCVLNEKEEQYLPIIVILEGEKSTVMRHNDFLKSLLCMNW